MNTSETSLGSAAACCDHDCACGALLEMTPRRWELLHRGLLLAWLTVGWNAVEGLVAVGSGWRAGSLALVGFGLDSFVEVLSGLVVLWRLRAERSGRLSNEAAERRAVGLIALSFFVVAAYVTFESARDLVSGGHARPSTVGLALVVVSLIVMPLLARAKRRVAAAMGSASVKADAKQTDLCTYLSATVLIGLTANALLGWWWMDSAAALVVAGLAAREGYAAWIRRDLCAC